MGASSCSGCNEKQARVRNLQRRLISIREQIDFILNYPYAASSRPKINRKIYHRHAYPISLTKYEEDSLKIEIVEEVTPNV